MAATILDFSMPHVLRNVREYDKAIAEVDELLDKGRLPKAEHDRLEFLTLLVESYEDEHVPMGKTSTPQSIVDFMLDQNGMSRAHLARLLGGRSRVSDFFRNKRPLSLGQIRKLRDTLGISPDLLIGK